MYGSLPRDGRKGLQAKKPLKLTPILTMRLHFPLDGVNEQNAIERKRTVSLEALWRVFKYSGESFELVLMLCKERINFISSPKCL